MSEELDGLFETLENDLLSKYEYNLLLNYITNLQEEVKTGNNIILANKNRIKELKKEITNLQKENEKLKETLQTDKLMKAFMVEHNRNEKAVELIRKSLIESDITGNGTLDLSNLLNILEGGDE